MLQLGSEDVQLSAVKAHVGLALFAVCQETYVLWRLVHAVGCALSFSPSDMPDAVIPLG